MYQTYRQRKQASALRSSAARSAPFNFRPRTCAMLVALACTAPAQVWAACYPVVGNYAVGTVNYSGGGTLGNGCVDLTGNFTVSSGGLFTITDSTTENYPLNFVNPIAGSGPWTLRFDKTNVTAVFAADNTVTGVLNVTNNAGSGTAVLQLGSGGTSGTYNGNISLGAGTQLGFNRSDSYNFTNRILGSGSVNVAGGGTITLSGNNTYTAGTSITGGSTLIVNNANNLGSASGALSINGGSTLQINNNGVNLSGAVVIGAGGGTLNTANDTLSGNITGTGLLTKAGNGTLTLSGADNSGFSGGIKLSSGSVTAGNANALGTGAFEFAGGTALNFGGAFTLGNALTFTNAGTVNTAGNAAELSGTITGTGLMTKSGGGVLTLSGSNTGFSGGITLNQGALTMTNANALGSGSFTFNGGNKLNISATGADLTGGVVFTQAGNIDTNGNDATISGALSGASLFTKSGNGALTLSNADNSNFSGGITLTGGDITIANSNSLGAAASTFTFNGAGGGKLNFSGTGINLANAITFTSNGTLNTSGNDATISGNLGGAGVMTKMGTGTLNLSGSNGGFTGGINLNGGALGINANDSLGTGMLTVNGNGNARLNFNAAGLNVANNVTLNNTLNVDTNGNTGTLSGTITGSGALTKVGNGTLNISGSNGAFTGNTNLNAGALGIYANDSLGTGSLTVNGNGNARLNLNTANLNVANAITFNNNGVIDTNGNAEELSGVLSGAGVVTKSGGGVLTLSGANTGLTGGINLNQGSIAATNSDSLGTGAFTFNGGSKLNINNAITLANAIAFTQAGNIDTNGNDATISGALSGAGALTKSGNGALTLGGSGAAFSGGINLNAGSIGVAASDALGTGTFTFNGGTRLDINAAGLSLGNAFALSSAGRIDNNGNDVTLSGNFSGASALTLTGAGNTTLSGSNGGLSGNVTIDKGIVTAGTSTAFGTGTLAFGNGGATPRLRLGASGLNIANNIDVTLNDATIQSAGFDGTLSGVISGANGLSKTGLGNLILTGTNTYTGNTTVGGGTLSVNGSIASSAMTNVNNGGTLGGTGTTGAVMVNSGGTLAPGNSIGTLNTGALTFNAGSTYRVEVDAAGNGDRTNANGTITINGGTVNVQANSGNYVRNTSYTILSSTGARTGAFNSVTSNLVFLTPTLTYLPNSVMLMLTNQNALNYGAVAGTPNQAAVAGALQNIINNGGSPLTVQIDNLTAGQAQTAFASLSGAQIAAGSEAGLSASKGFSDGVNSHLEGADDGSSGTSVAAIKGGALAFSSPVMPWGMGADMPYQLAGMAAAGPNALASSAFNLGAVNNNGGETGRAASGSSMFGPGLWAPNTAGQSALWGQAMGTMGRLQSNGNGAGSSYGGGGFIVGVDRALSPNWLIGAAGGYSRTRWNASINGTSPATGTIDTPQGSLYTRYTRGAWMASLAGGYADHKFDATRSVVIGATTNNATSSHRGGEWSLDGQVEYALAAGTWQLRPLVGVRYSHLREDAFTESGAGLANLSVNQRTTESTTVSAGLRAIKPFADKSGAFEAKAVYSHLFGDNDSPVSARLAGQSAVFTANGTPLKRDAITLSAGFGKQIKRNLSGFVEVKTEQRGSGQEAYAISGGLRFAW